MRSRARRVTAALICGVVIGAVSAAAAGVFVVLIAPLVVLAVTLVGPVCAASGAVAYLAVGRVRYADDPVPDWARNSMDGVGYSDWPPNGWEVVAICTLIGLAIWSIRATAARERPITA